MRGRNEITMAVHSWSTGNKRDTFLVLFFGNGPAGKFEFRQEFARRKPSFCEFLYPHETHETIVKIGGRGGIRTHGRVAPTSDFESDAFNHSATLPLRSNYFSRIRLRSKPI